MERQGTLQFAANLTLAEPFPPFPFTLTGEGLFTLEGTTFSYRVTAPVYLPWTSEIRGPGPDGPVLFDLRFFGCTAPLETNLGSCSFRGTVEVPDPWIPDLVADRWYVTATYHDPDADVYLRGQITV